MMSKAKISPVKGIKTSKFAHTSNRKIGSGDSYGTGVKNPVGKSRDVLGQSPIAKSKIGKAPKSLA